MRSRFALSVCASFVAGAAVAWFLGTRVDSAAPPAALRLRAAERPDVVRTDVRETDRSCDPVVAECEQARDFYRAQLVVYEGEPQTWPAGVPSAFTEARLRDVLTRSVDGLATVNEIRCEEYPCIALVALTTDDQSCCGQLWERLPEPLSEKVGGANMYQTEEGRMVAAQAFGAPDTWNAEIDKRSTWRMEQMLEEAQDR